MNKKELIDVLAKETEMKKYEVENFVKAFAKVIVGACAEGKKIRIPDFGTFEGVRKEESEKRNPQTGDKIIVPAHISPKFKFSSSVKKAIKEQ